MGLDAGFGIFAGQLSDKIGVSLEQVDDGPVRSGGDLGGQAEQQVRGEGVEFQFCSGGDLPDLGQGVGIMGFEREGERRRCRGVPLSIALASATGSIIVYLTYAKSEHKV